MKDFLIGLFVLMGLTLFCSFVTFQYLREMGAWIP
jgi:hypothetical protein